MSASVVTQRCWRRTGRLPGVLVLAPVVSACIASESTDLNIVDGLTSGHLFWGLTNNSQYYEKFWGPGQPMRIFETNEIEYHDDWGSQECRSFAGKYACRIRREVFDQRRFGYTPQPFESWVASDEDGTRYFYDGEAGWIALEKGPVEDGASFETDPHLDLATTDYRVPIQLMPTEGIEQRIGTRVRRGTWRYIGDHDVAAGHFEDCYELRWEAESEAFLYDNGPPRPKPGEPWMQQSNIICPGVGLVQTRYRDNEVVPKGAPARQIYLEMRRCEGPGCSKEEPDLVGIERLAVCEEGWEILNECRGCCGSQDVCGLADNQNCECPDSGWDVADCQCCGAGDPCELGDNGICNCQRSASDPDAAWEVFDCLGHCVGRFSDPTLQRFAECIVRHPEDACTGVGDFAVCLFAGEE